VNGEARGLRSTPCITAPETASPAPATMAATTLGILMFQTMSEAASSPVPARARSTSDRERPDEPAYTAYTAASTTASARPAVTATLRLV